MVIEQCAKHNRPLPAPIANKPELWVGLDLFYEAFWDLDTCREVGMGVGPIRWVDVEAYARARGFDCDQRADLHHHIRAMDAAYRKHVAKKAPPVNGNAQHQQLRESNPKGGSGHRASRR